MSRVSLQLFTILLWSFFPTSCPPPHEHSDVFSLACTFRMMIVAFNSAIYTLVSAPEWRMPELLGLISQCAESLLPKIIAEKLMIP